MQALSFFFAKFTSDIMRKLNNIFVRRNNYEAFKECRSIYSISDYRST